MHDVIDLVDEDEALRSSRRRPRAQKEPPPRAQHSRGFLSSSPVSSAEAGPSKAAGRTFAISSQAPRSKPAQVETLSSSPPAKATSAAAARRVPSKKRALDDSSDEEEIRRIGAKLGRNFASASSKKDKVKSKEPEADGISQKELDRAAREEEKRAKMADKARHTEEKKLWQEANRLRTSKTETTAELMIEMDAGLFENDGPLASIKSELISMLQVDGAAINVKPCAYESIAAAMRAQEQGALEDLHAIRIKRRRKARLDPIRRSFVPLPRGDEIVEDEQTVILCVSCEKLLALVEEKELLKTLRAYRENANLLFHQIVLCVQGVDAHFRKLRNKNNREYAQAVRQQMQEGVAGSGEATASRRRGKRKATEEFTVTKEQFDQELMRLKVAERCFIVQVEKAPELVQWIVSMIQDVGIRPYKLIRNSHLSFAVDAKINAGGTEEEIFSHMLQQIPRMTEPQAESIVYTFGAFRQLISSVNDADQEKVETAVKEVADCSVSTKKDGTVRAKGTRVGDALAKRLVAVLTSRDPLALMG